MIVGIRIYDRTPRKSFIEKYRESEYRNIMILRILLYSVIIVAVLILIYTETRK